MDINNNEKIMITTSRKPSQITRRFAQFLKRYFNITYINRGKLSVNKIMIKANKLNINRLLIISETKGNPSSIEVYNVNNQLNSESILRIFLSVSLPSTNNKILVNSKDISVYNKVKRLNEIINVFHLKKSEPKDERINYISIKEEDNENNLASVNFIDKNGDNTNYKIYIKGYDLID